MQEKKVFTFPFIPPGVFTRLHHRSILSLVASCNPQRAACILIKYLSPQMETSTVSTRHNESERAKSSASLRQREKRSKLSFRVYSTLGRCARERDILRIILVNNSMHTPWHSGMVSVYSTYTGENEWFPLLVSLNGLLAWLCCFSVWLLYVARMCYCYCCCCCELHQIQFPVLTHNWNRNELGKEVQPESK